MGRYDPPFQITDEIMNLTAPISEQLRHIDSRSHETIHPYLRRANQIRTIHSSRAIEHNSLSLEQVTALIEGKRVLGNPNEKPVPSVSFMKAEGNSRC